MPKLSNTVAFNFNCPVVIPLDIKDTPGATYKTAIFMRGDDKTIWPLLDVCKPSPELIFLYLEPHLPVDLDDDPDLPLDKIQGQLNISLMYNDPQGLQPLVSDVAITVVPTPLDLPGQCEIIKED